MLGEPKALRCLTRNYASLYFVIENYGGAGAG